MNNIYLDLDGVIGNFCDSACNLFNIKHIDEERQVNCVSEYIGVSKNRFWSKIDQAGFAFWAEIKPYPWFEDLINLVNNYDQNFMILTAPSNSPSSHFGKKKWIEKHFGRNFDRYIFTPAKHKYRLSFDGDILIDDSLQNIEKWNEKGYGIIFPQPWNGFFVEDKLSYVKDMLDTYFNI